MKKEILILAFAACYCSVPVDAQKTTQNQCDSIQMFYDQALVVLDSVMGNQIQLQTQLDASRADISKSKSEIRQLLKDNAAVKADLKEAGKLYCRTVEKN